MQDKKSRRRAVRRPDKTTVLGQLSPEAVTLFERVVEVAAPLLIGALVGRNVAQAPEPTIIRACTGSTMLCGLRPTPTRWVCCPYCGTQLAVRQ